jgi:hypothetical protein
MWKVGDRIRSKTHAEGKDNEGTVCSVYTDWNGTRYDVVGKGWSASGPSWGFYVDLPEMPLKGL